MDKYLSPSVAETYGRVLNSDSVASSAICKSFPNLCQICLLKQQFLPCFYLLRLIP